MGQAAEHPRSRVLVTGGAGFVGSHLVHRLAASGHEVAVLDTLEEGSLARLAGAPHHFIHGSILEPDSLAKGLEGADFLVHLAALVSVPASLKDPAKAMRVNGEGTRQTLEAAAKAGVKRVVQASTSAVYGPDPILPSREDGPTKAASPYAESKLAAERHAKEVRQNTNLSVSSMRFFNIYGPGQNPHSPYSGVVSILVNRALTGEAVDIFGDGGQTRDLIYVEDAARAIEMALFSPQEPPEIVNIGTGASITLLDLLDSIEQAFEVQLERRFHPPREGDVRHSVADVSLAQNSLGFAAQVTVQEGIQLMASSITEAAP